MIIKPFRRELCSLTFQMKLGKLPEKNHTPISDRALFCKSKLAAGRMQLMGLNPKIYYGGLNI